MEYILLEGENNIMHFVYNSPLCGTKEWNEYRVWTELKIRDGKEHIMLMTNQEDFIKIFKKEI